MLSYNIGHWIGENVLFSSSLEADDRMPCVNFTIITTTPTTTPPHSVIAMVLHRLLRLLLLHEKQKGEEIEGDDDDENNNNIVKFGLLLPRVEFWIALVTVSEIRVCGDIYGPPNE